MLPTLGLSDQVTAVLPAPPVTLAVSCWLWPIKRLALNGLTMTLIGEETLTIPEPAEIGSDVLSAAAANKLLSWIVDVPRACGDNVTFTMATTPPAMGAEFIPSRMHRLPEQTRDLPAAVATAPAMVLVAMTLNGVIRSHCIATG